LLDQQELFQGRLDEVEEKLAAFVGFDAGQKGLAGCYVSIAQDGTAFVDKGLVKPEHRKELARLLKEDGPASEPAATRPKNPLSESLRRDLAASRLQVAQVEIARNPAIGFDLLVFHVATAMLSEHECGDGPDVAFNRPRLNSRSADEPTVAA